MKDVSLVLALFLLSCAPGGGDATGDGRPGCSDRDGDGAGVGDDCAAADCDDFDPGTIDECGRGCDAHPTRRGCPCPDGIDRECFTGPEGTGAVGACDGGRQYCEAGVWSACEGQRLPTAESCNGEDDDCDGLADDGVTSACGDCNETCEADCVGLGCAEAFEPEEEGARSIVQNPDGSLTLDGEVHLAHTILWVANAAGGTVSKLDTRTHEELARYRTGPSWDPQPSRSAVNLRGDVVSANRVEGSATKILASDCVDRDGDGLSTSTGPGDVLPWGEDDCVAWHTEGLPGARGSAIEVRMELDGAREYAWVGAYQTGVLHELDAETGEPTGRSVADVLCYGAALGPGGILWSFGPAQNDGGGIFGGVNAIVAIDTTTLARQDIAMPQGEVWYGITVDARGRVWLGGSVSVYDPASAEWHTLDPAITGGGIAVDADGHAWTGEYGAAWRIDGETLVGERVAGAGGHGWAIDADGYAWSIEHSGTRAFVVDPRTLSVDTVTPPFDGAYTYSDMTGFQLANATSAAGTYPHVFEACDGTPVHWARLTYEADLPPGATIGFRVKTAATAEALAAASWSPAGTAPEDASPLDLDPALEDAGISGASLLAVEATLRAGDAGARPTLRSLGVERSCVRGLE